MYKHYCTCQDKKSYKIFEVPSKDNQTCDLCGYYTIYVDYYPNILGKKSKNNFEVIEYSLNLDSKLIL